MTEPNSVRLLSETLNQYDKLDIEGDTSGLRARIARLERDRHAAFLALDTPPASVLSFLNQRARRDHNGDVFFADDDGSPILDLHRPGVPNADARAVAQWTRQYRPELWEEPKAETPVPATPTSPSSAAEFMQAVKAGRMSEADAITAMRGLSSQSATFAPVPYKPTTASDLAPQSISARMVAARTDPAAMAALNAALGLK